MNSAAIAIDWSMRVNVRFEEIAVELDRSPTFPPRRRSAPSPRPSRPGTCRSPFRRTASRRRCRPARRWRRRRPRRASAPGWWIIDSIICVAVMVSLLRSRAIRIIRFCSAGTAASPTSTARSPRATMMPSEASMISSSAGIASARSILAISSAWPPAARSSSRAICMSSPRLAGTTRRESRPSSVAAVLMSSMSFAVSAGADRPPPCRLMPLLFDSVPPTSTRGDDARAVDRLRPSSAMQAVVEQQHRAGLDVARQLLVVEADAVGVAERRSSASSTKRLPGFEHRPCRRRTCRCGSSAPAGRP